MAITAYAEGSPTIGTTEYSLAAESTTLATKTDVGAYQLTLDLNALAAGDVFLVTLYEAGATAGTKRVAQEWVLDGVQLHPILILPTFVLGNGWDWTIDKVSGTDRAIPFTIWQLA